MRAKIIIMLGIVSVTPNPGIAQQAVPVDSLEARVWLDRGDEPVVQRGDEIRVYYRTSADAYAAIFRIDTDGVISLIFPQHPDMDSAVRGGRDYRLLFPRSARWRVDEDPGAGYFFIVASPEPLDFSLLGFDDESGWDLGEVGATVYEDPYVAIDDYVAAVVPDWEVVPFALDFLQYSVGDTHEYPRFLCYDCHAAQSYSSWNPYGSQCSSYRVVIWDDPYFYPRTRYVGTRVVFARPFGPRPRYGVVSRVGGTGWAPLVRTRAAPPRRVVEYKESPRPPAFQPRNPTRRGTAVPSGARPSPRSALPNRTQPTSRSGGVLGTAPRSSRIPAAGGGRAGSPRATSVVPPKDRSNAARPTLQRRPSAPGARPSAAAPPSNRGTTSRGTATRRPTGAAASGGRPSARTTRPTRPPPRATSQRPPARAVPTRPARAVPTRPARATRPTATRTRPPPRAGTSRPPTAGNRAPPPRRPAVGTSGSRPPTRARPTPRRRPGGRGG